MIRFWPDRKSVTRDRRVLFVGCTFHAGDEHFYDKYDWLLRFCGNYKVKTLYIFSRNKKSNYIYIYIYISTTQYFLKLGKSTYTHTKGWDAKYFLKTLIWKWQKSRVYALEDIQNLELLSYSAHASEIYHFCMIFFKNRFES